MKKINELLHKKSMTSLAFLVIGLLIGWLLFGHPHTPSDETKNKAKEEKTEVWTCSMHPQIKQDHPGKCPICGMDLIPLMTHGDAHSTHSTADSEAVQLSEEAMALANVQTTTVSRGLPVKEVRLYGKILPDERRLQSQTAYVGGRVEQLHIAFTGQPVHKGETLATLYSPELYTAQQELLEALRMDQPALAEAARQKLRLWNMTDAQIDAFAQSHRPSPTVAIKANTSGVVTARRVSRGDYVQQGAVLFEVADLSRVWAVFDAFETDLPFLSKGENLTFTLPAFPGKRFSGNISFIDPVIDATTHTARVRVEVANAGGRLKPEMYAMAEVKAPLKENAGNHIVIPRSAVLWTGKRSVVYVRLPESGTPSFRLREIELGPSLGDAYIVSSGLEEGEEIVTNGVFAVDASAQLEGKTSMMNPHEPSDDASPSAGLQPVKETQSATLTVQGNCDMCKERIEETVRKVKGVTKAVWNKQTKQLAVVFNARSTTTDAIEKALAKAGHDTAHYKADRATYDALPECCKYRE